MIEGPSGRVGEAQSNDGDGALSQVLLRQSLMQASKSLVTYRATLRSRIIDALDLTRADGLRRADRSQGRSPAILRASHDSLYQVATRNTPLDEERPRTCGLAERIVRAAAVERTHLPKVERSDRLAFPAVKLAIARAA